MISGRCSIKLSLILFTTGLITMGCQEPGPIASPDQTSARKVEILPIPVGLDKKPARNTSTTSSKTTTSTSGTTLPTSTVISTVKDITVAYGGTLELWYREASPTSFFQTQFAMGSIIWFKPGSISQDFKASFALDGGYMMSTIGMEFGPHGTNFLEPAILTIYVTGCDLSYLGPKDEVKLFYDDDGEWEEMDGDVYVDRHQGTITCLNGKLPHFSRYAFGRYTAQ